MQRMRKTCGEAPFGLGTMRIESARSVEDETSLNGLDKHKAIVATELMDRCCAW